VQGLERLPLKNKGVRTSADNLAGQLDFVEAYFEIDLPRSVALQMYNYDIVWIRRKYLSNEPMSLRLIFNASDPLVQIQLTQILHSAVRARELEHEIEQWQIGPKGGWVAKETSIAKLLGSAILSLKQKLAYLAEMRCSFGIDIGDARGARPDRRFG
jgi:hypothetical protein